MRKTIFLTMCLAALFSCEMKDNGTDIDLSGYTVFKVDMEAITIDGDISGQRVWKQGDMIGVFGSEQGDNAGFYLKQASDGKTVAEFYGPLVKGDNVRACFPYDRSMAAERGGLPCELAPTQLYDPQKTALEHYLTYSTRAFATLDDNNEFHFAYPYGILEVVIALDEPVIMTGARLSGQGPLSGKFLMDAGNELVATDISQNGLSLDFGGKEYSSKDGARNAAMYFVLPPAVYAAGELTLEIDVKGEASMAVLLDQIDVHRVDCSEFSVTSVAVNLSDIPGLEIKDGYLE